MSVTVVDVYGFASFNSLLLLCKALYQIVYLLYGLTVIYILEMQEAQPFVKMVS